MTRPQRKCQAFRDYYQQMTDAFGIKFILFLFIVQCALKGIIYRIASGGMLPLFKSLGVEASQLQIYASLTMIPWSLKPMFGVLSDLIPLWGFHKRIWLLQAIALGTIGAGLLCFQINSLGLLLFCFLLLHYEVSWADLLSEGKYAELMRDNPHTGSNIVTLVNGFQKVGDIVAMLLLGPLSDANLFGIIFLVLVSLAWTPLLPLLNGFLPEERRTSLPWISFDREKFLTDKRRLLVIGFAGLGGPAMALTASLLDQKWIPLVLGVVFLGGSIVGGFWAFSNTIARVGLYLSIARLGHVSVGSALDYFYTATEECLPGGPHFSYKYYITFTGIIGAVVSFAAVWLYQLLFSKWRYRSVLIMTTIIHATGGIFDFIMVMRWNVTYLHIPDHVFYVLGDAIVANVVMMLYWIPSSSIIGKVCPPGLESSTYAYLAGLSNFAGMMSELIGAFLLKWFRVFTTEPCYWENLPWLILFGHIGMTLLIGIPAAFLIPNIKQTDPINEIDREQQDYYVELDEVESSDGED